MAAKRRPPKATRPAQSPPAARATPSSILGLGFRWTWPLAPRTCAFSRSEKPRICQPSGVGVLNGVTARGRGWLLAAVTALYVARPLVPNDPVTDRGDGAVFAVLWLLLATLWLLQAGYRRRLAVRWGAVDLAFLALIGWHTLSGLMAVWQGSPRPAINVLWQWLALALGFFLVRQLVVTAAEARAIMVAMIALGVALAALGIYQRFSSYPRDRARYERIKDDPGQMIATVGQYFPPGSPERMQFESRLQANEPTATFALTNSLAGYLAPWLVVALGLGWHAWSAPDRSLGSRLRLALLALPMAVTLILTRSRSGVLAVAAGAAAVWPAVRPRRPLRRGLLAAGVAMGLVVGAVAVVASGGIDRQLLAGAGKSLSYRLEYWRSTWAMIGDHPWLGCGPGQFQDAYTQYKLPQASEEIRDPHNFVLEVWATAGSPAALALIVGLTLFIQRLFASRTGRAEGQLGDASGAHAAEAAAPGPGQPRYVIGGAAAGLLLAALVGPLAGFQLELVPIVITALALGAGLLIGEAWRDDRQRQLPFRCVAVLAAVGLFTLLVNLLAAGGIGYPGVAGTLWLLLAVGLNATGGHAGERATLPGYATALGLATTVGLLLACYSTAYRPVLQSRVWITRAQLASGRDREQQRTVCLQQAVDEDPLSTVAAELLAAERFRQWQADPTRERVGVLRAAVDRATRLAPRASAFWSQTGQWWVAVAEASGDPRALEWALDAHLRAVRCYPNSALLRARYAMALEAAGRVATARKQAAQSLDLDAVAHRAGHKDKWLDNDLRDRMTRIAARGGPN